MINKELSLWPDVRDDIVSFKWEGREQSGQRDTICLSRKQFESFCSIEEKY